MGCPARETGEPHEIGVNRQGYQQCKHCYTSAQTITGGDTAPIEGWFRVICEGRCDDDSSCHIGPSSPVSNIQQAKDRLEDHQTRAEADDGQHHRAKIVQL